MACLGGAEGNLVSYAPIEFWDLNSKIPSYFKPISPE